MKKRILLSIVAFSLVFGIKAQEMNEGTNFLSLGVGPSTTYGYLRTASTPALKISFDHGLKEIGPGVLTLGGSLGFFGQHYSSTYGWWDLSGYHSEAYKQNWVFLVAAFRVGYYYNFKDLDIPNLNAYAGVATGVRYHFYNYSGPSIYKPADGAGADFHMAAYAGANYFVSKKFAFFTEFGYDISYVTLGMTFQL